MKGRNRLRPFFFLERMMWRSARFILWLVAALLITLTSCNSSYPTPNIIVAPAPTVEPPPLAERTPACTQNPPGLALNVTLGPISKASKEPYQAVRIEGKGFVPGESLRIQVSGEAAGSTIELTETKGPPVEADGSFKRDESLQVVGPNMQGRVVVKHQRGVACADFLVGS